MRSAVPLTAVSDKECHSEFTETRLPGVSLARPLLLADLAEESRMLAPVKQKIREITEEATSSRKASEVTVYFRRLNDGAWFAVNPNQTYNPASMIKVPIMMTFLREAEKTSGLLDRKVHFDGHNSSYKQNIGNTRLRENRDYTIRTLLEYMIQFSDNDATVLLQAYLNQSLFNKLFTDLNIPVPDFSSEYFITASDMSKFFRALYNGTYLSEEGSEYALGLLTRSTYSDGIVAGIGEPMVIAHKFGERVMGNTAQLHEFGIVYCGNQPYLIGIMTQGSDLKALTEVVKAVSGESFRYYKSFIGS
jgi:beta-lactamase class A